MNNKTIDELTNAFLRWPLPDSVCADPCATKQGPGRIGTNLLSFAEAKQMFQDIVMPELSAANCEAKAQGEHAVAMTELAQSLQRELTLYGEEITYLRREDKSALRAELAETKRLLGEVYRNTNLCHHPELTGLADIVSKQLTP